MRRVDMGDDRAVLVLAVVFGATSIPWTYAFGVAAIPLWPSFIASAGYYASPRGPRGVLQTIVGMGLGVGYAAATLGLVGDTGLLALSLGVGAAMLIASLHPLVDVLSYGPAAFLGYAALFSVDAAAATVAGLPGLWGVTMAALVSVVAGAAIGLLTDLTAATLRARRPVG
mgnify:CR=1 FL=1